MNFSSLPLAASVADADELLVVQTGETVSSKCTRAVLFTGTGGNLTGLTAANLTGLVPVANGGLNAILVPSLGGIVYSTATAGAVLAGTATANQVLLSGSSAAPAWSTATYPATTTINRLLWSSAANVISDLATANNGVLVTSAGGVPSISSTLPSAVQGNITSVGTLGGLTVTAAPTFSAMSAGSVLFAGTAGLLSQDNANFFYNSTSHIFGIGTNAPVSVFEATLAAGRVFASNAWSGNQSNSAALTVTNSNPGGYDATLTFRQSTSGTPTLKTSGAINMIGTSAWTNGTLSTQISDMQFILRDDGGLLQERMRITSGGNVSTTGNFTNPNPSGGSGVANERFGAGAGNSLTTGQYNTFIGKDAGTTITTGSFNVAMGRATLGGAAASQCTAIGYAALNAATADACTAVGYAALASNTSGALNTAVGFYALGTNTTGQHNGAFANSALTNCIDGSNNMAIGYASMSNLTHGNDNTCVGNQSGQLLTTGNQNTCIGSGATVAVATQSNGIALGYNAVCAATELAYSPYLSKATFFTTSSTSALRQCWDDTLVAVDNTDATRKYRQLFNIWDTAQREAMRFEASGSAAMIGFFGAAAVVRQTLAAAASDAASTQTLANSLRTALINLGLGA